MGEEKLKPRENILFRRQVQHPDAGLHPPAGARPLHPGVLHPLPPPRRHELGRVLAGP